MRAQVNGPVLLQRRDVVRAEAQLGHHLAGTWLELAIRGVRLSRSPEDPDDKPDSSLKGPDYSLDRNS
jgi:hypothetical protein